MNILEQALAHARKYSDPGKDNFILHIRFEGSDREYDFITPFEVEPDLPLMLIDESEEPHLINPDQIAVIRIGWFDLATATHGEILTSLANHRRAGF